MLGSAMIPRPVNIRLSTCLGLAAAVGYGLAFSPVPVAGESAQILALQSGLTPAVPLMHPFWGLLVHAMISLGGNVAGLLNAFSSVCVGLALTLWCRQLERVLPALAPRATPPGVTALAALLSTVALAMLPPVVHVATRAHPGSWELLLLMVWSSLVLAWWREGRDRWLMGAGAMTGLSALDITAFPIPATVAGLLVGLHLWRRPPPRRWSPPLRVLVIVLLGVVISLGVAFARVWFSDAYTWREDLDAVTLLRAIIGQQALLTRGAALGFGWLLPSVMALLPCAGALLMLNRLEERPPAVARILAVLAVAGCSVLLLLNLPPAPWRLLPTPGGFRVACLASALTLGLCVLTAYHDWRPRRWTEPQWRRILLRGTVTLTVVLALAAGVRLDHRHAPRATAPLYTWARETIGALGSRHMLVTDGLMDSLLALAAREANHPVTLLDLSRGAQESYLPFVAAQCPTPELGALAHAGLVPVLREWLRTRADAPLTLAVLAQPDPWLAAGLAAIPERTLYLGTHTPGDWEAASLLAASEAVQARLVPALSLLASGDHAAAPAASHLLESMGRHANNLGVALENLGDPQAARRAYTHALSLQPGNVCSAVNRLRLDARMAPKGPVQMDAALALHLSRVAELPLALLTARYGHVRDAEAVALLRPDPATRGDPPMQAPTRAALELALAGDLQAAARALDLVLDTTPGDLQAWVLRGLLAARGEDAATLDRCLAALRAQRHESVALLVARARLAVATGEPIAARELLTRALRVAPEEGAAQELLLLIALREPEAVPPHALVSRILARDPGDALANYALGLRLYREGDPARAAHAFRRSLARRVTPDALNNLAWILQVQGETQAARLLVEQALQLAPAHAAARDTLEVIQRAWSPP